MFDNNQSIEIDTTDERILPKEGTVSLNGLLSFVGIRGVSYVGMEGSDEEKADPRNIRYEMCLKSLVEEINKHKIPVLKLGDSESYWLVRLEDIHAKMGF